MKRYSAHLSVPFADSRFAAVRLVGRRYQSISAAAACGGGQCHVGSVCR